ncbi:MAG: hypothetical protein AB7S65_08860 [Sulfuricurvum sp.]
MRRNDSAPFGASFSAIAASVEIGALLRDHCPSMDVEEVEKMASEEE